MEYWHLPFVFYSKVTGSELDHDQIIPQNIPCWIIGNYLLLNALLMTPDIFWGLVLDLIWIQRERSLTRCYGKLWISLSSHLWSQLYLED